MGKKHDIDLFTYVDYRLFLRDYCDLLKKRERRFSFAELGRRAGFQARDFLTRVIKGQKNLSEKSAASLCDALGLSGVRKEYLIHLVGFNQCKDPEKRNEYYYHLSRLARKKTGYNKTTLIPHDKYELYSQWYHTAVRSLIGIFEFKGDFEWLAKKVSPQITVAQAKKSVQLLLKLNLIRLNADGAYNIVDEAVSTGDAVVRNALGDFYRKSFKHAAQSIEKTSRNHRHINGITMGVSLETYEKMTQRIIDFRKELAQMAVEDENADRVYQLTMALFPVSEIPEEKS